MVRAFFVLTILWELGGAYNACFLEKPMHNLTMPNNIDDIEPRQWETFQPFFEALQETEIPDEDRRIWLEKWSEFIFIPLLSQVVGRRVSKSQSLYG